MQDVAAHSQTHRIEVPKPEDHKDLPKQIGVTIMKQTIVGVDIAKNVMQARACCRGHVRNDRLLVHWVDPDSGEIVNKSSSIAGWKGIEALRMPSISGRE
jgi:hypothetical protein